jgi:Exonuclease VII, large subunit
VAVVLWKICGRLTRRKWREQFLTVKLP